MNVAQTTSVDVITQCRHIWTTGDGDADCQAQAEVFGQKTVKRNA